jgi:hypothetical protein
MKARLLGETFNVVGSSLIGFFGAPTGQDGRIFCQHDGAPEARTVRPAGLNGHRDPSIPDDLELTG